MSFNTSKLYPSFVRATAHSAAKQVKYVKNQVLLPSEVFNIVDVKPFL